MATRSSRWDLGGWGSIIVLSGIAAAYLLGRLINALVKILGNRDVPVAVPFEGTSAPVAFGDVTAPVRITEGVIHVTGLHGLTYVCVLLGEILRSGAPIALLALLAVFAFRMARERVFDRTNVRLVTWAGVTVLIGWGLGGFIAHMGVNGAVATLSSGDTGTEIASGVDFTPIAVGVAAMLFGVVFETGMRMKRETEGLV